MEMIIHRGCREIGGSCVQISAGGTSILLDAGEPLGQSTAQVDLAKLSFDAVFISHPHKDHFGLIESLDPSLPVYVGPIGRQLMDATRLFLGQKPLGNTFREIRNRQWIEFGTFRIRPYLMDHSCVDAFGFLIEAGGKRLYYSGDFRAHGRKSKLFNWFLKNPPTDVDALLLEGTMMRRNNTAVPDEDFVEKRMLSLLREQADLPCLLICSGQNIDRICAAYRACLKAGRTFVIDIYTAYVLRLVSSHLPNVPDINKSSKIKVLTKGIAASSHYRKLKASDEVIANFKKDLFARHTAIDMDEVIRHGSKYLVKVGNYSDLLAQLGPCNVIYSMWDGYLREERFTPLKENPNVTLHQIHTSGHAIREDLKRLVDAVNPKHLIPIHTEHSERFFELGSQVRILNDGEIFHI